MEEEEYAKKKKNQETIERKKIMVVSKPIRMTARSARPQLNISKKETVKLPPEVEEMRRYLGIVPEDWTTGMEQSASTAAAATLINSHSGATQGK